MICYNCSTPTTYVEISILKDLIIEYGLSFEIEYKIWLCERCFMKHWNTPVDIPDEDNPQEGDDPTTIPEV